ncbi:MAG TPA: inositol monophosphatase family protein [Candidatus Limnocylindrales bacterium]
MAQIVSFSRPLRAARLDAELAIATDAARHAGRLQMERYERLERIVHKAEHDVVTEVDTLSEQLIINAIRESFPRDSILAEESGRTDVVPGDGAEQRVWIIDPLDGTVNYANGIPCFCVSVGLAIGGRPMMGVVYDPTRDEMFTALAGMGAKLDGLPIRHPGKDKLLDCVVSLSLPRRGWARRRDRVGRAIRVSRNMGSAALALAYLANGRFDAFVQAGGLSLWDICAAGLIAVEGGARLTTLDGLPWFDLGRPTKSIALLGAAPAHHQTLLEMLA